MKAFQSLILVALVFCFAGPAAMAQDDFSGMINHLPAESNSVFLINAKALGDAPPAVMEKWETSYSAANDSSPLALPEGVQFVAMSTEFDIQHMSPLKQAVVLALEKSVTACRRPPQRDRSTRIPAGYRYSCRWY